MIQPLPKAAIAALFLCLLAAGIGTLIWTGQTPTETPAPEVPSAVPETDALLASHGLVWREGAVLHFRMKSGEVVTLTDHLRCGDVACPDPLAMSYRYAGWDDRLGGYKVQLSMGKSQLMVLTYDDDEPALLDARHGADAKELEPLPAQTPAPVETDGSLAEWLADLTGERDQSEKQLIAQHPDQVKREGGVLSLTLSDHRHLRLEDDLVCGQLACPPQISRSFDYMGQSPDGLFYVVRQAWNEAEEGLMIDRQGTVLVSLSVPSFAPDGQTAVAAVADLEASAPRRLEVWDLDHGRASLVFSVPAREDDDTVYEVVGWVDASHLRLKRGHWGGDQRTPVMLVKDRGGWHIEGGDIAN